MTDMQTTSTRFEELERCREWSWFSEEDEMRFGNPEQGKNGTDKTLTTNVKSAPAAGSSIGLVEVGANVTASQNQHVGHVTKQVCDPGGKITHLLVQTSRIFGRSKLVPIDIIDQASAQSVTLSISRRLFFHLSEYHSDFAISEDIDQAISKDVILRNSDYHQVNIRVKDGFVALNGHVISRMNQWRVETAVKTVPGVVGVRSFLIADDTLLGVVAGELGVIEHREDCKFFTNMENGVVVIMGDVDSGAIRDEAEACAANIPYVRGVMNQIQVNGVALSPKDDVFMQPMIGKTILFKDDLAVTVRKVIINPHNRRVTAVVALGRFDAQQFGDYRLFHETPVQESLVVIPTTAIQYLTPNGGFLNINSVQTGEYQKYDHSHFIVPDKNWIPPYPYCHAEVLFQAG